MQAAPPRALADLVTCLWGLETPGDESATREPRIQRILPDGRAEIIFHLADPFCEVEAGAPQAAALTSGQLTRGICLKPGRRIRTVGIRLTPAGARALLQTPQHQLLDRIEPLDAVHRPLARRLEPALSGAAPIDSVLDALARALTAEQPRLPRLEALAAFRLVERRAGLLTVDDVRAETGLSGRTLERTFLDLAGVSPRLYLRLVRFRHAVREAEAKRGRRWTDVALACGYYDHAHFTRDFTSFAGCPPSEWLRSDERALATWFCGAVDELSYTSGSAHLGKEPQP